MVKIVYDANGLIKLVKSGIFPKINHENIISQEVYKETVIEGKKRMYDDAFIIGQLINDKKIKVKMAASAENIIGLGKGELTTLQLFHDIKANVIVSDDRRFLRTLEEKNINFTVPTEVIVALVANKRINKNEGIESLKRIRPFVRKENYNHAKRQLEGENEN